jgi:hypothetical protein
VLSSLALFSRRRIGRCRVCEVYTRLDRRGRCERCVREHRWVFRILLVGVFAVGLIIGGCLSEATKLEMAKMGQAKTQPPTRTPGEEARRVWTDPPG